MQTKPQTDWGPLAHLSSDFGNTNHIDIPYLVMGSQVSKITLCVKNQVMPFILQESLPKTLGSFEDLLSVTPRSSFVLGSCPLLTTSITPYLNQSPPTPSPSNYLETWIICVHQFQGFRSMATSLRKTLHKDIFRDARFISIFYNRWHPIIDFCHKISRVYPKHDNQFIWILQCI